MLLLVGIYYSAQYNNSQYAQKNFYDDVVMNPNIFETKEEIEVRRALLGIPISQTKDYVWEGDINLVHQEVDAAFGVTKVHNHKRASLFQVLKVSKKLRKTLKPK